MEDSIFVFCLRTPVVILWPSKENQNENDEKDPRGVNRVKILCPRTTTYWGDPSLLEVGEGGERGGEGRRRRDLESIFKLRYGPILS